MKYAFVCCDRLLSVCSWDWSLYGVSVKGLNSCSRIILSAISLSLSHCDLQRSPCSCGIVFFFLPV